MDFIVGESKPVWGTVSRSDGKTFTVQNATYRYIGSNGVVQQGAADSLNNVLSKTLAPTATGDYQAVYLECDCVPTDPGEATQHRIFLTFINVKAVQ